MPFAAAPAPGTCCTTRTRWSASTSTPSHAGRGNSTSARAMSPRATSTCVARNCSRATTWSAAVSCACAARRATCSLQELAVPLVRAGIASRPAAQLARPVRCRRRQVGRGRAGLVGPGRATSRLGCHPARLSLPTPHAGLEAIAQRLVRVDRRAGRVRRRPAQGDPPGRDADGAQR